MSKLKDNIKVHLSFDTPVSGEIVKKWVGEIALYAEAEYIEDDIFGTVAEQIKHRIMQDVYGEVRLLAADGFLEASKALRYLNKAKCDKNKEIGMAYDLVGSLMSKLAKIIEVSE